MRLVTFNILHGRSLSDGLVDADRFTSAVAALDADVLALQEVDRDQPRSGYLDLAALAARTSGAVTYRFAAALVGTPGGWSRAPLHPDDCAGRPCYGVALASRWPVRSWHVTRLAATRTRWPLWTAGPRGGIAWPRDEPRVLLAAVVESPAGLCTIATTHLSFVPGHNVGQLRRVVRALNGLPAPRILLGDLNMPAGVAALASGWRVLTRRATYPAWRPRVQLDHVLLGGAGPGWPAVSETWTPPQPLSDHRPLVLRFAAPGSG